MLKAFVARAFDGVGYFVNTNETTSQILIMGIILNNAFLGTPYPISFGSSQDPVYIDIAFDDDVSDIHRKVKDYIQATYGVQKQDIIILGV